MKDEKYGRQSDGLSATYVIPLKKKTMPMGIAFFILHPSSFILHPSSFLLASPPFIAYNLRNPGPFAPG
jgi:hypothetical protein